MNQRKQLNDIYLKQGLSPITYTDSLEELTVGARDAQSEDECEAYILLWQLSLEDEDNISCLKDMQTIIDENSSLTPCQLLDKLKTVLPDCIRPLEDETRMYYYHKDHLSSSSYLTKGDGGITHQYEYLPYGEMMYEKKYELYPNRYKFSAKEYDEEPGYYYFGARYYYPRTSQWLSVDPLASQFPNKSPYNYCSSNPIGRIDPTGMSDSDGIGVNEDGKEVYNDGKKDGKLYYFGGYKGPKLTSMDEVNKAGIEYQTAVNDKGEIESQESFENFIKASINYVTRGNSEKYIAEIGK